MHEDRTDSRLSSGGATSLSEPRPDLLADADAVRVAAFAKLDSPRRSKLGQFGTPAAVANLMASMFGDLPDEVRLLDAGAGSGSLTAAFVAHALQRPVPPSSIHVSAYEVEPVLAEALGHTLDACRDACESMNVQFSADVIEQDFIEACVFDAQEGAFAGARSRYNCAIQNPPYKKINSKSDHRRQLRGLGIETSNLYSAFVALTIRLLERGGQLVSITPRSFCNGPYFKLFRREFLSKVALRKIHVFDQRDTAFGEDSVLQENVILHAVRGEVPPAHVTISASTGAGDDSLTIRDADYDVVAPPGDESFIHVLQDDLSDFVASRVNELADTLWSLNVEVSTGRVVDFRAREFLRQDHDAGCAPLLYPVHFDSGFIRWPVNGGRKPNAIAETPETEPMLFPAGWYVLVKRFSTKEERRRVVASVVSPESIGNTRFAVENHVNVFHRNGRGLPEKVAKGLATFLNSTLLDMHFRQFSGHTQVNATDLRGLRYPAEEQLIALGKGIGQRFPTQDAVDGRVERALLDMAKKKGRKARLGPDPVKIKSRVEEARSALKQLGFPSAQTNERSALTLLALLNLKPEQPWSEAGSHLLGITPMMEFMRAHYGKNYAANTRETVRRQTVHQFLEAALVTENPDEPTRPINSGKYVYQIEARALTLLRTFGTEKWEAELGAYLKEVGSLRKKYAQERDMHRIPVALTDGTEFTLSPGGQNPLVADVINEFCPRFVPGSKVVYVGDTDDKYAHFDVEYLKQLGVEIPPRGKIPDVVVHDRKRDWLLLIEAVTSHGPIDPKRHAELVRLFSESKAGLVFVTTFPDRATWLRYAKDISWETEVWIAEDPTHLIHYDGERFLGPYGDSKA